MLLTLAAGLTACGNRPAALGEATLQDIINTVEYGPEGGPLETARNGASVDVGTQVKSGANSLAQLAFSAGPTARLSPNTSVTMQTASSPEEVRLRLEAGRLRLSLFGHRFGVATPLGLIHLDGFGDISYQVGASPEAGDDALSFRCLAGPCLFQSEAASLALNNLEALTVVDGGLTMTRTVLVDLDLRQFIADNPGSIGLLATLTAAPTRTSPPTLTPTATTTQRPEERASSTPDASGTLANSITNTPTATRTATRPPVRTAPPRPTDTSTPAPTATPLPTDTPAPGGGGDNPAPPPTNPPPTNPPPTDTPVPPPTDTPPPPPPPSKTPGG
ncbi:MAG: FecR domain-containing protein [Anaerolineales bacterium]|nr:FecR domain-containing protein [Anaerolineales bacterium]